MGDAIVFFLCGGGGGGVVLGILQCVATACTNRHITRIE